MRLDILDWLIALVLLGALAAATVFTFMYPAPLNFATLGTIYATLISGYHWLRIRDQKIPDAGVSNVDSH